jgi:hypothetical protein
VDRHHLGHLIGGQAEQRRCFANRCLFVKRLAGEASLRASLRLTGSLFAVSSDTITERSAPSGNFKTPRGTVCPCRDKCRGIGLRPWSWRRQGNLTWSRPEANDRCIQYGGIARHWPERSWHSDRIISACEDIELNRSRRLRRDAGQKPASSQGPRRWFCGLVCRLPELRWVESWDERALPVLGAAS